MNSVILARHGESEYSARGRLNGDIAIPVGLTGRGQEEARVMGHALRDTPIGICVTSAFQRARETADEALAGREIPRLVLPELNDPLIGPFEGGQLDDYRAWASTHPSTAVPTPGGESRLAIVERYGRGFRTLLARPEEFVLAVCHSLPVAYALGGREGRAPGARTPLVDYATPYPFTAAELATAAAVLENWAANPTW